ncbi:hypothetical protein [Actinomadura sp. 9N215]|uniref:hypothetical protein n=1 Tax=Actinomadura sp. 9N215 TaxID=3375150 RepID=UPI00379FC36F
MDDATFADRLRQQAEHVRKVLDEGTVPEGALVIHRDDLDRWRDATPEEWAAGRLET